MFGFAAGGLSAVLRPQGDSPLYTPYLKAVGAAIARRASSFPDLFTAALRGALRPHYDPLADAVCELHGPE